MRGFNIIPKGGGGACIETGITAGALLGQFGQKKKPHIWTIADLRPKKNIAETGQMRRGGGKGEEGRGGESTFTKRCIRTL